MAYTYDDFVTAASGAGLLEKFSDDDLKIARSNPEYGMSALKLQQDLNGAKTTEQQLLAQEAINQLRTSYGNPGTQTPGSFKYGKQTEYQKLLDEVTNMGSFSYDAQNDPSADALKKTYLREGERARADTLARVSAATGGAPSSYAVTAAQQAGDYYNTQFADKLIGLEENAYQRYLNEFSTKMNQLGAMSADRDFDFNAYLQNYDRQQAADREAYEREQNAIDRELAADREAYDREQDAINRQLAAEQEAYDRLKAEELLKYQQEQNAIDRELAADREAYERGQDAKDEAYLKYEMEQALKKENYNRLLALMTGYGYQPTAEELAAAGMTEAQMRAILGLNVNTGSGGSSGGGSFDQRIYNIQKDLIEMGYNIPLDGIDGPITEAAYADADMKGLWDGKKVDPAGAGKNGTPVDKRLSYYLN